jgi:uncharacterized protein (DUF1778 family)
MGAPKKENAKDKQLKVRVTKDELNEIKRLASSQNKNVGEFVRLSILKNNK